MTGRIGVRFIGAALLGGVALLCPAVANEVRTFDIPAEDAGKSIPEFARQAGRQIVAPGERLRGVRTPALRGTMDISVALGVLLQSSELEIASNDSTTIILRVRSPAATSNTGAAGAETVTVTGYRASLESSANAKRGSVEFSDTVFAEDIGKFADTNIAEAFNRIPGITISREIDGSGVNVSIRGLGSNFTKVLLNSAQIAIASTGPTNASNANREVDLNMFPVEFFTKLSVQKSPRPDQLEGGTAGAIVMRSARPFDNPGFHLTYSLKAIDVENQNTPTPNGALIVSDTEGPFGVLVGVTGLATRFFTRGFETVGWTTPNLLTTGPVVQCASAATCNLVGGGNWTIPASVPANVTAAGLTPGHTMDQSYLLSLNPGLTIAQLNNMLVPRLARPFMEKGVRSRYNGVASFEYRLDDTLYLYLDLIGGRISNNFDRSDINWIVRNGADIPVGVKVDSDNIVSSGTFANAQWFLEARPYREYGDFFSINPGGEWLPSETLHIWFQANASRSHYLRDSPTILVDTAPNSGYPVGVTGPAAPAGGVYVVYANRVGGPPSITTNVDLNDPDNFQWVGGRVNISAEKRYTYTNGLHLDAQYGDDRRNIRVGLAYDGAYRSIRGYENSQAWQNAVCGDDPNTFVPSPNSQPICQGLSVTGSAADVNAVASGYPIYPGHGTGYSTGYPALAYRGSLIPQSNLSSYLKPGSAGFVTVDYAKFFKDSHYGEFSYPIAPVATGTNLGVGSGSIDERNLGVYGELNGALDIGSRSFKYNMGLRWVQTLQIVTGPLVQGDARNTASFPLDGGRYPNLTTYTERRNVYQAFLPSLNVVYEVADDFQVRASLSRTMTRPNPSSLLPGVNFSDPSAAQANLGNPALAPYFSNNIDIGAELYTSEEGYVGVVAFRKTISGFTSTSTATQPFTYLAPYGITYANLNPTQQAAIDARGGPNGATIQVSQVVNASGQLTVRGLEFTYVQPLEAVLGWKGFGVTANFTVVDQKGNGAAPAIALGVSPYTYNLTAYYENIDLSLRASYVFNGKQVVTDTNQNGVCLPNILSGTCPGGARNYSNVYAQLDFSSSLKLSVLFGRLPSDPELMFDVENMTKSKLRGYFQYPQAIFNYYAPGATYLFGLRGTF